MSSIVGDDTNLFWTEMRGAAQELKQKDKALLSPGDFPEHSG